MSRWWCALWLFLSSVSWADRASEVRARRAHDVKALVQKAGLVYPVAEVYLRAFKRERQLELWASAAAGAEMVLLQRYRFCAASGGLGPKRRQGDRQVPEGLYEIVEFNPASSYHLSLKVSYPNQSDRLRSDKQRPGGLIYLHGDCVSIGCIAIGDESIEEVFLIAADATKRRIRFDIFPARLTTDSLAQLGDSTHFAFWASELAPAFAAFEMYRRPPEFSVSKATGAYVMKSSHSASQPP